MAAAVLVAAAWSSSTPARADHEQLLPIVFYHGASGSGAQFQTQAMRFASNGYPAELISAYEPGAGFGTLNQHIDAVRAAAGTDQVVLIGHSAGTFSSAIYLLNPAQAAKVAKYIAIDGLSISCVTVQCTSITQATIPGQAHVEVATSAESFAIQYEFITGHPPATTMVLPEPPGEVTIAGRIVNFPANTGLAGGVVEIWEVHPVTGARKYATPEHVINVDPTGFFGPLPVNGQQNYEFNVMRPDSPGHVHYYFQPFVRSTQLLRINSSPPTSATSVNACLGPHTNATAVRYREWYGSGANQDILNVTTTSPSAGNQPAVNVMDATNANNIIGLHLQERCPPDQQTDLGGLGWNPGAFQAGFDLYMLATDPADGYVTFSNAPRGDTSRVQTIAVPNRASAAGHHHVVSFNDYVQDINTWGQCLRTPSCRVLVVD